MGSRATLLKASEGTSGSVRGKVRCARPSCYLEVSTSNSGASHAIYLRLANLNDSNYSPNSESHLYGGNQHPRLAGRVRSIITP
jgi:hypothetical protein